MGNLIWCKRRVKMILLMMEFSTLLLSANAEEEPTDTFQKWSLFFRWMVDDPCNTPECVKAAKAIMESIDESVDPCDDFYQFSCGGWIKTHEIPADQAGVFVSTYVQKKVHREFRVLLEKNLTGTEPEHIKKLKNSYDTCMDVESIEAAEGQPLKDVLKTLGGWPVVEGEGWDGQGFDWIDTVISMSQMGYGHRVLITLYVEPDTRNNSANIIYLNSAEVGYVQKGLKDRITEAYYKVMVELAILMGADPESAKSEMMEALKFEISLYNFSLPKEEIRNKSMLYNRYTAKQLQEQAPQIDWMKYLNGILMDPIPESEPLIVKDPRYMKEFANLISNTDKRVVANYLLWNAAANMLDLQPKEWRALMQPLTILLSGKTEDKPRWEQCIEGLKYKFKYAFASYYVKNYFPKESKDRALELVRYIRQEFLNILDSITWMDQETKHHAREKALAMKSFIGYPDELLNDTMVSELYENLTITDRSLYENMMGIRKWLSEKRLLKLRKPNVFGDWKDHAIAHVVNAFYDLGENSIEFPAGILQDPFFQKDRPHYMNFGNIGCVIGHEITHRFDDQVFKARIKKAGEMHTVKERINTLLIPIKTTANQRWRSPTMLTLLFSEMTDGRQHDKEGHNVNWWDTETDARFKEKAKCIIEQYSNYTSPIGLKLNGVKTQSENIADNGGMKEAYRAYQSWVKDHQPELKLPGLKYTPNQLFWISAASGWCANIRPESLARRIQTGVHSPPQFRVIGPMSNFPEFSKDFNCAIDSPMNPQKKCEVW